MLLSAVYERFVFLLLFALLNTFLSIGEACSGGPGADVCAVWGEIVPVADELQTKLSVSSQSVVLLTALFYVIFIPGAKQRRVAATG